MNSVKRKAVIAMSGGVDSSVSALIMKQAGYDCAGAMMKLNSETDEADAEAVADRLSMPFYLFDFTDEFGEYVIGSFIETYKQGKTPNPCVECNRCLKFGLMLDRVKELDYDLLVTGHYARVEFDECKNRWLLKKAVDGSKDQSYVLYMLTQEQLSHIRFPLGELHKTEVRKIAEENGFVNADKKDSQDICFVPDGDYVGFIERYTGEKFPDGSFAGIDGTDFGKSKNIINYTLGQRRGLGVAYTKPLYVCAIDAENNRVILGDNEDLFTDTVTADSVNLISVDSLKEPVRVSAKVRYRHREQPASAWQTEDGLLHIKFDEPQRAVTKGQSVVLYDGDTVVGGGKII